jgi:hypothetical protein
MVELLEEVPVAIQFPICKDLESWHQREGSIPNGVNYSLKVGGNTDLASPVGVTTPSFPKGVREIPPQLLGVVKESTYRHLARISVHGISEKGTGATKLGQ